jgi:hypothetical protein
MANATNILLRSLGRLINVPPHWPAHRSRPVAQTLETTLMTDPATSEKLAREFFARVWTPPHELDAINELMTEDYKITTAGTVIAGRENFKTWVAEMQGVVLHAANEHLEVFTNATGDRVVSRWITRGANNGMFGLPADLRPIAFSGIAIWRVEGERLAECWVERSAFELFRHLRGEGPAPVSVDALA